MYSQPFIYPGAIPKSKGHSKPPAHVYDADYLIPNYVPANGYMPTPVIPPAVTPPSNGYRVMPPPNIPHDYPFYHQEPERRPRSHENKPHKSKKGKTLENWTAWRTSINQELSRDILHNTYTDIPVGENFQEFVIPPNGSKHGVYHYSSAIDQATKLQKEDYINFGIPRANVPRKHREEEEDSSDISSSDSEADRPFYVINKIPKTKASKQEHLVPPLFRNGASARMSRDHSPKRHTAADKYSPRTGHR